jgi:glycosyltransferase involved in cell wall biosynthesis
VIPPPPLSAAVFDATRALAGGLPNLEVRGHLDRRQLGELLATGGLFLHTSGLEGFPNTMLEAWAHGLPTVSVVDPDGIVARERLGEVAGDPGAMEAAVTRWMGDPQRRRDAGARAHAYVRGAHAPDAIVDRVAAVFDDVIRKVRGG